MKTPENILTPESKEKEKLYMCGSCGFSTEKIEDLHEERENGGVTHTCPECKNYTGQGSKQSWETRDEDIENAEKEHDVHYLDNSYGVRNDCKECKG